MHCGCRTDALSWSVHCVLQKLGHRAACQRRTCTIANQSRVTKGLRWCCWVLDPLLTPVLCFESGNITLHFASKWSVRHVWLEPTAPTRSISGCLDNGEGRWSLSSSTTLDRK